MEIEIKPEAKLARLNNAVAITVVFLAVFMAVSKIKDDNIVQAMQAAKADAVDTWNEYQAARLKLHMSQQSLAVLGPDRTFQPVIEAAITKYEADSKSLAARARGFEERYDALNFRDDQFDLSDAALAISLSLSAVSVLVGLWWLLGIAWAAGAVGLLMGVAGFAGWSIHPDWLIGFLS